MVKWKVVAVGESGYSLQHVQQPNMQFAIGSRELAGLTAREIEYLIYHGVIDANPIYPNPNDPRPIGVDISYAGQKLLAHTRSVSKSILRLRFVMADLDRYNDARDGLKIPARSKNKLARRAKRVTPAYFSTVRRTSVARALKTILEIVKKPIEVSAPVLNNFPK